MWWSVTQIRDNGPDGLSRHALGDIEAADHPAAVEEAERRFPGLVLEVAPAAQGYATSAAPLPSPAMSASQAKRVETLQGGHIGAPRGDAAGETYADILNPVRPVTTDATPPVELHGLGTLPPPGAIGNATPDAPQSIFGVSGTRAAADAALFPGVEESAWIRNAVESEHRSALEFVGYCREKSWGYGQAFFERLAMFLEGENNALAAASKAGLIREAETRG